MGCFNKFVLFVTNFIVFGIGVAVVVLASIIISKDDTYGVLLSSGTFSLPIIILIVGLIILFIGFLGCCGAMKESSCMLYLYAGIVIVLLLAEVIMGILVLVYTNKSEDVFMKGMDKIFRKYGEDDHATTKALDEVQQDLQCCGVRNYTDWENYPYDLMYKNSVADGCCMTNYTTGCGIGVLLNPDVEKSIYTEGCFYVIKDDMEGAAIGLGVTCLILAIVQVVSISCACGLAKSHK